MSSIELLSVAILAVIMWIALRKVSSKYISKLKVTGKGNKKVKVQMLYNLTLVPAITFLLQTVGVLVYQGLFLINPATSPTFFSGFLVVSNALLWIFAIILGLAGLAKGFETKSWFLRLIPILVMVATFFTVGVQIMSLIAIVLFILDKWSKWKERRLNRKLLRS